MNVSHSLPSLIQDIVGLTELARHGVERASMLQQQCLALTPQTIPSQSRKPSPEGLLQRSVLLIGQAEGALGHLTEHWLGKAAAEALGQAGGRPLLIAAAPDSTFPATCPWPRHACKKAELPVILLDVSAPVTQRMVVEFITHFRIVAQVIAVTRLAQALPTFEAAALSPISQFAAAASTLAVVYPGESAEPNDVAQILPRCTEILRRAGFATQRHAGFHLWAWDQILPHPAAIKVPGDAIAIYSPSDASSRASQSARFALVKANAIVLLQDIAAHAEQRGDQPLPQLSEGQCQALREGFAQELQRLHQTLLSRQREGTLSDSAALQTHVLGHCLAWSSRAAHSATDIPQQLARAFFDNLEALRPGTVAILIGVARLQLGCLQLPTTSRPGQVSSSAAWPRQLAYRLGGIIVGGLAGWWLAFAITGPGAIGTSLGLMFGSAVGSSLARRLAMRGATGTSVTAAAISTSMDGWPTFTAAIEEALAQQLKQTHLALPELCRQLSGRIVEAQPE